MSLRQQFSLLTMALVVLLLGGSLLFTLGNTRQAFEQQLNARAYDAASALSLSMSQVADDDDTQLLRIMDALYDRGFFEYITYEKNNGQVLSKRNSAAQSSNIPAWFKEKLPLNLMVAEADVMGGWQRLGTVQVVSHSEQAYQDLWDITLSEVKWYALVLVLSLLLLQWILTWLLKPLRDVEQQAKAICERQLKIQHDIPRSRELRQMVLAMNQMVHKLRSVFSEQVSVTEQLRTETFHDELSGLLNRRGFDQRLEAELLNADHSGVLFLLQLPDLAALNQRQGRQAGDDLIHHLGLFICKWLNERRGFAGRRSGSDFAVYIPCTDQTRANELSSQLFDALSSQVFKPRLGLPCHIGAVLLQDVTDSNVQALSRADEALRQAQTAAVGAVRLYQETPYNNELTAGQWQELLMQVLHDESLELLFQPVVVAKQQSLQQLEIFSAIVQGEQRISAGRFWPMVEKYQLAPQFDALIIRKVLKQMQSIVLSADILCCVNISAASVADETFIRQLQQWLKDAGEVTNNLAFEVPESALLNNEAELLAFAEVLKPFGARLGVDKVGTGGMAFSYLQRMPFSYLRIDGSFGRGLAQAQDQRFFVRSMVQIANSLERMIMAEGIEAEEDSHALQHTGIQVLSGYLFSRPLADIYQALNWKHLKP